MIIFTVILATVAGSYTWGMRGTILGGEKGAVLPGAALGLIFAFACNSLPVSSLFAIPAAAGGAAMFFGGAHTYGETIGLSYNKDKKIRWHGRTGLFIKGANWFGIFGGIMGLCFAMLAGRFKLYEIIIFVALLPAAKWLGFFLLNWPQKPSENKFPKFYFSVKRFEIWGGMLMLCIYIALFAAIKREWFAVIMTVVGFVSGGLGFFIGNHFQTATSAEREDGKYILGALQRKGFVGSWKFMEFTLGALGGLGTSLCFCLCYDRFVVDYVEEIALHGGTLELMSEHSYNVFTFVWLTLLLLYTVRFAIPEPRNYRPEVEEKYRSGAIALDKYEDLMAYSSDKKPSSFVKFIYGIEEYIIWPVFCYIPLFLAFSGNVFASEIISFFLVFWLVADKVIFDGKHGDEKGAYVLCAFLAVLPLTGLAIQLFTSYKFSAFATFLMYSVSYEITELYLGFNPAKMRALKKEHGTFSKALLATKSGLTVRVYSLFCVAVMLTMGYFYFV